MVMNQRLNRESGRKAVVLFTDGVDTTSRHASYASNVRDAEELDALVYPVQYDTYVDQGGGGGGGSWPRSPQIKQRHTWTDPRRDITRRQAPEAAVAVAVAE